MNAVCYIEHSDSAISVPLISDADSGFAQLFISIVNAASARRLAQSDALPVSTRPISNRNTPRQQQPILADA